MVQNAGPVQATFAGPKLTASPNAVGKATVHADLRTLSGEAALRIRLKKVIVADGAPADAATKFAGAVDPARKPSIVYPSDGVMVPPNMNEIEWHYQPGAGNDLFELGVKGSLLDLRVYFACKAVGCRLRLRARPDGMGHRRFGGPRRRPALDHACAARARRAARPSAPPPRRPSRSARRTSSAASTTGTQVPARRCATSSASAARRPRRS